MVRSLRGENSEDYSMRSESSNAGPRTPGRMASMGRDNFFVPQIASPKKKRRNSTSASSSSFAHRAGGLPSSPQLSARNSFAGGFSPPIPRHQGKENTRTRELRAHDEAQLRLLRRDMPFRQSGGTVYMHRAGVHAIDGDSAGMAGLALHDIFHVALSMPAILLFSMVIATYTSFMILFAIFFVYADQPDKHCGVAPEGEVPSFYRAFSFSFITMTTIGYTIPEDASNFFDEECLGVLLAVYFEAILFILMNATMVGVLFARVGRASNRASQIIFSDKAVIRCVRNHFYFMFQVGETPSFYHSSSPRPPTATLVTPQNSRTRAAHPPPPGGRGLLLLLPSRRRGARARLRCAARGAQQDRRRERAQWWGCRDQLDKLGARSLLLQHHLHFRLQFRLRPCLRHFGGQHGRIACSPQTQTRAAARRHLPRLRRPNAAEV